MAKKNSKKSYWECKEGCDLSKRPCKHLEREMNIDPNKGRLTLAFMKDNQDAVMRDGEAEPPSYSFIESKLRDYGLRDYEIELLLDYYVAGLSLRDIKKKHNYVCDSKGVWRLLSDLTDKLRKSPRFKELLTVNRE